MVEEGISTFMMQMKMRSVISTPKVEVKAYLILCFYFKPMLIKCPQNVIRAEIIKVPRSATSTVFGLNV